MAGKNTAVFGVYRSRAGAEQGVDALRTAGFRNTDISVLFPENEGTKDLLTKKTPRRRKARPPEQAPAHLSAELWGGWRASERWRFLV